MKWIVTGAAGFIGCNATAALLARGDEVVGIDNLSRPGAEQNLEWVLEEPGRRFALVRCDVRDAARLSEVFTANADADAVLHLAGQVAVTTSIRDPRSDFEANALGTFNVCEAVREHTPEATLLYASTNKVYGEGARDLELVGGRWWSVSAPGGIGEWMPLDFHSPYACSKGAGEQYILDYFRTYGVRTVSLRQSCIYGPRQFGIEDQGWVAWLTAAALANEPFTIYGDGRQVRDLLFVDDLVALYVACAESPDAVAGKALNVGGGPDNALSLLELVDHLERRLGRRPTYGHAEERLGDQRFFVADIGAVREALGWRPQVRLDAGLERLTDWIEANLGDVLDAVARRRAAAASSGVG